MSNSGWDDDPSATRTDAESPEAKQRRVLDNLHGDLAALRTEFRRMRDRVMLLEERLHDVEAHLAGAVTGS